MFRSVEWQIIMQAVQSEYKVLSVRLCYATQNSAQEFIRHESLMQQYKTTKQTHVSNK